MVCLQAIIATLDPDVNLFTLLSEVGESNRLVNQYCSEISREYFGMEVFTAFAGYFIFSTMSQPSYRHESPSKSVHCLSDYIYNIS